MAVDTDLLDHNASMFKFINSRFAEIGKDIKAIGAACQKTVGDRASES